MKLPISMVKIDRSLVISYFESGSMLLPDVIEMFRNQKLQLALVGVETKDMARRLSVMGCDYLQGYFYSRTLPARDFVALMKKRGSDEDGESVDKSPASVVFYHLLSSRAQALTLRRLYQAFRCSSFNGLSGGLCFAQSLFLCLCKGGKSD